MNTENIGNQFFVEEHAVMFALLSRAAITLAGEKGRMATNLATQIYGKERGVRMAMRALADGAELTPFNYMLYGEWVDHKNEHTSDKVQIYPEYHLHITNCAWTNAWKKHGLQEYGQLYCPWIDECLEEGFNKDNRIGIDTFLSYDAPRCNFQYVGVSFNSEEELDAFNAKRQEILKSVERDFLYHTAHMLNSMRRTYLLELGAKKGLAIVDKAMKEFEETFGLEKAAALDKASREDFLRID